MFQLQLLQDTSVHY